MAAIKKAKTLKKKTGTGSVSAKKKSAGKTASVSRKPSAKSAKTAESRPAKKKPIAKKTVSKKPPEKRLVKKKIEAKVERKTDRLEELKKALMKKKEAIIREAKEEISKYISGENRQLVDTALDEGDWAVVDISEDISLMRLAAHRRALRDIDESLRKIREGTYGICEECGEEISEKRLSVLPTATLCINCQENKEQLEAFEKEETP